LGESDALSQKAMDRTLNALEQCADRLNKWQIMQGRFVATEACRRAHNGMAFIEMAKRRTGLDIEIISSTEEARLAFLGCSNLLQPSTKKALVFDIGGGSTELVYIHQKGVGDYEIKALESLPYGVVTVFDAYTGNGRCVGQQYEEIVYDVTQRLERFAASCPDLQQDDLSDIQVIGVSGTVTTLAGVFLDLPRYNRSKVDGLTMSYDNIIALNQRLHAMTPDQRSRHPCIGPERSELLISGCAILEAICRRWPVGQLTVADRGVREGLLLGMMHPNRQVRMPE
jgi:exopolyphosphatase/guanosine-5'-triphosphate,3'-diphosphate pyrophosphatase